MIVGKNGSGLEPLLRSTSPSFVDESGLRTRDGGEGTRLSFEGGTLGELSLRGPSSLPSEASGGDGGGNS